MYFLGAKQNNVAQQNHKSESKNISIYFLMNMFIRRCSIFVCNRPSPLDFCVQNNESHIEGHLCMYAFM